MQTVALHTRLKAGSEEEYERIHKMIPPDLDAALREAGVHDWRIWRDGQDLFHLVTVEDYRAMRRQLAEHPANIAWQATVGHCTTYPTTTRARTTGSASSGDCRPSPRPPRLR